MTSWADPQQLLLLFSLMLLAAWAIGGRFEFKGFTVPEVSPFSRVLCVVTGVSLLFIWLGLVFATVEPDPDPDPVPAKGDVRPTNDLPESTQESPNEIDSSSQDLVAIHRQGLMTAIRNADDAEISAAYTLDPSPLYLYVTGVALQGSLANIQSLSQSGNFLVMQLHDQAYESFSVSGDEMSAEVRLTETWTSELYVTATQQCVAHVPEHDLPQTIVLERANGEWIVSAITHHSSSPSFVPGCG